MPLPGLRRQKTLSAELSGTTTIRGTCLPGLRIRGSLPARIRETVDRKVAKLVKYQGPDSTTIPLVENDGIALMNECKLLDAIRET